MPPTGTSPISDIVTFVFAHIGVIVVITLWVIALLSKMVRAASRPPARLTRPTTSPMTPPTTMPRPTTASRPMENIPQAPPRQEAPRPAAQPKFRPQTSGTRQAGGSAADQLARERADYEQFVKEQRELEAGEPAALGTSLTSPSGSASAPSALFSEDLPGSGANANLLRAIMLAQALGPPRTRAGRRHIPAA